MILYGYNSNVKIFTAITNLALFALMVLSVFVLGNRVYADDTRYLYQTLSQRQADTGRDYNNSEARNFLPVIPQQQRFAPAQPIFNPDLVPPPELPRMQEYRFRGAGSP